MIWYEWLIGWTVVSLVLWGIFQAALCDYFDGCLFNPMRWREQTEKLNWFGIIFWVCIITVVLLPAAIFYWFFKLMYIGRKEE